MVTSSVVNTKGQLVIPAKFREELGLKPGVRVVFSKHGNGLLLKPGNGKQGNLEAVLALCGAYAGLPLEEDLRESRRQDEERLNALCESVRP